MRILIVITCFCTSVSAQGIFEEGILHEIEILTDNQNVDSTLISNYSLSEAKHLYALAQVFIDGKLVDSIGIRYKGNKSYDPRLTKKSIKLDFNEFVKGQKFQGLRKLNLHNNYADPSFLRDAISYHLLREMGIDAPRTSYARLKINGATHGIYLIVEQIDKSFTPSRLFKNIGFESLSYKGNAAESYRKNIDIKGNDKDEYWTELISLLKNIDQLEGKDFEETLRRTFDIESFLKILAVYTATNNYDSILKTGRNWYLAHFPQEGRFAWIPWDGNISFEAIPPHLYLDCQVVPNFLWTPAGKKTIKFYDDSDFQAHASMRWNFGDGNYSTSRNPSHTYKRKGKYTVCLELSLSDYCSQEKCIQIDTRTKLSCLPIADKDDVFKSLKVKDKFPTCCGEWTELCELYYQGITPLSPFKFSFYPNESSTKFIQKVLSIDTFKAAYRIEMCNLLENHLTIEKMDHFIDQRVLLIAEEVSEDNHNLYSYEEFNRVTSTNNAQSNIRNIIHARIAELRNSGHCK